MQRERVRQIQEIQEVITSEIYTNTITSFMNEFEERRKEFLTLLENQPGFLQSSFLSLHRKLKQKYKSTQYGFCCTSKIITGIFYFLFSNFLIINEM